MSHFFSYAILTATVATALGLAAPFLLAALGETVGQRSGVINLGVDGIMLLSAFATYFTALKTGNLFYAILTGMGVGAVMGVITAFISVTLKAEQGISGIGIYLFGLGFSDLLFIKYVGTPLPISTLNPINIPLLDRIPAIGGMFFKQTILVYLAFLLVPVVTFMLNRTNFGMKVRAVGENPGCRRQRRRQCRPNPLGGHSLRLRDGWACRGGTSHVRRHLSREPHPERGLHSRCPRLLRCLASDRGHGWFASLRLDDRSGAGVEVPRHHSAQRLRPLGDRAGCDHDPGAFDRGAAFQAARSSWEAL